MSDERNEQMSDERICEYPALIFCLVIRTGNLQLRQAETTMGREKHVINRAHSDKENLQVF